MALLYLWYMGSVMAVRGSGMLSNMRLTMGGMPAEICRSVRFLTRVDTQEDICSIFSLRFLFSVTHFTASFVCRASAGIMLRYMVGYDSMYFLYMFFMSSSGIRRVICAVTSLNSSISSFV